MKDYHLSIITPTCLNRAALASCLQQVSGQTLACIQHIVVSDGPDPSAERLCRYFGVDYFQLPARKGEWGRVALDVGITLATAPYVVFWYDGHLYPPDSAHQVWSAAQGHDLGVVRVNYWRGVAGEMSVVPRQWSGRPEPGDIDAINCCVRREFLTRSGLTPATVAPGDRAGDGVLWRELQNRGARVNYDDRPIMTYIIGWQSAGSASHIVRRGGIAAHQSS